MPDSIDATGGAAASAPVPSPDRHASATAAAPSPIPQGNAPPLSPTRPPYIPQFTAATQMILKRMRGEQSSLSSALASASVSTSRSSIAPSKFEDVRRRLVMNMSTSSGLTMHLPAPEPSTSSKPTAGNAEARVAQLPKPGPGKESAIKRVSAGLTTTFKPSPSKMGSTNGIKGATKKPRSSLGSARTGAKRKHGKEEDNDNSSLSSLSDLSDTESKGSKPSAPPTTTKSGRQVLKPTTYNPAAMDSARKRVHYGKRTAEQQLCKKCTRLHSPASNQMVFCDGCNDGWHQMCHDPWIEDEVVNDPNKNWYCGTCLAKREHQTGKKRAASVQETESRKIPVAKQTPGQKRAYLSTLPHAELVNLLMKAVDLHPDLPIFPTEEQPPRPTAAMPRSLFAGSTTDGLFVRAEANPNGTVNFIRKVAGGGGGRGGSSTKGGRSSANGNPKNGKLVAAVVAAQAKADEQQADNDREDSPFAPPWPKAGKGLYSRLPPEADDDSHLVDDDDHEAFSVIVFDEKGRKIEENGMKV